MSTLTPNTHDVLSIAVHDLRSPLVPIVGYSEMILAEKMGALSEQQRAGVAVILRNARKLQDLVDLISDWVYYEAGKLRIEKRPVDVRAIVQRVLDDLRPVAGQRVLALHQVNGPVPLNVLADPERLRRVLSTLVLEIVRSTPSDGRVTVSLEILPDRRTQISMTTNAVLISDDTRTGGDDQDAEEIRRAFIEPVLAAHGTSLAIRSQNGHSRKSFELEPV